jgi:molybdenum cofactor cytidylyltransferase
MGHDKALLPLGGETFIQRLIGILHGQVRPLLVVLGHNADEIEAQISSIADVQDVQTLRNPDYQLGQLSSLQTALRFLNGQPVAGALVCLVDHPAITVKVVRSLLDRFLQRQSRIIIPTCRGRRGHPVFFAADLFQELLDAPLEEGARVVVRRHEAELDLLETAEEGILVDVDRPGEYQMLLERWGVNEKKTFSGPLP